jgi:hypothetical protein
MDIAEQVLRHRLSPVDPLEEIDGLDDDDTLARALLSVGDGDGASRVAAE